jgi:hypothetical protein
LHDHLQQQLIILDAECLPAAAAAAAAAACSRSTSEQARPEGANI